MPSKEMSKKKISLQISACRADINALPEHRSDFPAVTSCHAGLAAIVMRTAISVAIASRTAGRACMRAR
ncbi:hypothetical protein ACVWZK_004529 [Bradyrhizobium sp. GM0.4]